MISVISIKLRAAAVFTVVLLATADRLSAGDEVARNATDKAADETAHETADETAAGAAENARTGESAREKFFVERVVPLLREHCYECHSHESGDSSGNLMLDSLAGMLNGGSRGPTIVPSQPDQSILLSAVTYAEADLQMPPSQKLDEPAIEVLRQWIADGAAVPQALRGEPSEEAAHGQDPRAEAVRTHWAYRPPQRWSPAVDDALAAAASDSPSPAARSQTGSGRSQNASVAGDENLSDVNVIDTIVRAQLAAAGLTLSPQADRATLLRRLSYDLTGLPPTPSETEQVLDDPRDDAAVISELIDRLIAAPSFGERWARFWMDVSRYADNKGYVFQEDREYPGAHQYRSWLIRAFNQDLPYDQFVTQQLAADLLTPPPAESVAAPVPSSSSTSEPAPDNQVAESQPADTQPAAGQSGGTQLAQSQLSAGASDNLPALGFLTLGRRFLNNRLDIVDDRVDVVTRGLMGMTLSCARCHDHKFDPLTQADYYALSGVFYNTDEPGGEPWPHRLVDSTEDRQAFILIRGSPGRRGDPVPRRFISLLAPDETPFGAGSGRVELARYIVSTENPLTARVMANRLWLQLTGRSLIESPSDLGIRSPQPTQLALLDQLAVTLSIDQQWSMKSFIRTVVSSRVYQQSSQHRADCAEVDPENFLYWKMNRRRLEFEPFRDTLLVRVGQLDRHLYGPSETIETASYSHRRTVYAYIDRQNLPQVFRTFDAASPDNHTPIRAQTSVPQQGLYLLNSEFVSDLAQQFAQRGQQAASIPSAQAGWMFSQLFCRAPTAAEQTLMNEFLQAATDDPLDGAATQSTPLVQLAGALLAANELAYID